MATSYGCKLESNIVLSGSGETAIMQEALCPGYCTGPHEELRVRKRFVIFGEKIRSLVTVCPVTGHAYIGRLSDDSALEEIQNTLQD